MSAEREPLLEKPSADARRELEDEQFVAGVMASASRLRRRRLMALLASSLVAVPALGLIVSPLNEALLSVMELISRPIAETDEGLAAPILSPLNSIAALLAAGLLALRAIYKWLFA